MALPKIAAPTFELTQPSTGKPLQYRPFLVKEEKILLTARESGEKSDIFRAIKQIVNNCIVNEEFDVNKIPLFDMEYIFINLRSKSVGNIVKFKVQDSDDNIEYDLELNLDEVEVEMPEEQHDGIIKLNDNYGIKISYPTADIADSLKSAKSSVEVATELLMNSIQYVFDEETTYPWSKESTKEKREFIDSLSVEAFEKIQKFFDVTPKIEHVIKYTNSLDVEKRVVFRNLEDFFTFY